MRTLVLAACAVALVGCPQPPIVDFIFGEPTILTLEEGVWAESTLLKIDARPGEVGTAVVQVRNVGIGTLKLVSATRTSGAPVRVESDQVADPVFEFALKDATFIEAGVTLPVPVTFRAPAGSDSAAATVELLFSNVPEGQRRLALSLIGTVGRVDCLTAMDVDFGRVAAGEERSASISVRNPSSAEQSVTLSQLVGDGVESFTVVRPAANQLVVAPNSTATIPLFYRPTVPGVQHGLLTLRGTGGCPDLRVSLRGEALPAPRLQVEPGLRLEVGAVPFFPGRQNLSVRHVTLSNTGLGRLDFFTTPVIEPLNPYSRVEELCLGEVDASTGACAFSNDWRNHFEPGESTTLALTVSLKDPNSDQSGLKAWRVRLFTNDATASEVQLTVTARPLLVSPCNYRVDPEQLAFGPISSGTSATLTGTICNLAPVTSGGDLCLLDSFRTVGESASSFSVDPASSSVSLRAGACLPFAVKASSAGLSGIRRGFLEFSISDPSRARVQIPLSFSVR